VLFEGRDLLHASREAMRRLRRRIQVVFQDPYASLNPCLTIDWTIGEALHVHGLVRNSRERRERVAELLRAVGLSPDQLDRYPHEFSGGQRQRIGIARALALQPALILLDEAVSALDVSIQAQILNLLSELQEENALTYVFVSHDLHVVGRFCDHIGVMHRGRMVEQGPAQAVLARPADLYTSTLLAASDLRPPAR
jgi:peptide/nickel transport system ATP-binding protein/oligopeptide transport system ATP-binding protein